jgi:toxin HigB-1
MVVSFSCAGIISPRLLVLVVSWRVGAAAQIKSQNERSGRLFCAAAIDLLLALNVAKSLQDLSPLRSVGLHKLKGARKKQWAMTVNDRWRICFEFRKGDAFDVEIVDYHKG